MPSGWAVVVQVVDATNREIIGYSTIMRNKNKRVIRSLNLIAIRPEKSTGSWRFIERFQLFQLCMLMGGSRLRSGVPATFVKASAQDL